MIQIYEAKFKVGEEVYNKTFKTFGIIDIVYTNQWNMKFYHITGLDVNMLWCENQIISKKEYEYTKSFDEILNNV